MRKGCRGKMHVEIVGTAQHRHIQPIRASEGADYEELVPGRTSCVFVLQMPDGKKVLAEVTEETFEKYISLV
jgi:hypothetical protein